MVSPRGIAGYVFKNKNKNINKFQISPNNSYKGKRKKYNIVIARWQKDKTPCCSRSCNICIKFMKSLCDKNQYINRIYYFNSTGKFGFEYLSEMEENWITRGTLEFALKC